MVSKSMMDETAAEIMESYLFDSLGETEYNIERERIRTILALYMSEVLRLYQLAGGYR